MELIVPTRCTICGAEKALTVSSAAWDRWKAGALVQEAFSGLPPEDRESLMTGVCTGCWDRWLRVTPEDE